jgi:NAD(P)-dependent dehydrogenase (short-subunit alcohol dehydrogenase family)
MGKLTGKFAVVTGASRGIGKAIALAFAAEGAALLLASRSAEALAEVAESAAEVSRAEAIAVAADVSD